MATTAEIQTAYKALYRADLNATVAAAVAGTGISVDAYIAQQLPQVATTTQASVAIAAFVTGLTPTSDKLDALTVDANKQVASYTAMGSSNPQLGAFEAFGRAFATDSTTGATFTSKYGALSNTDFISVVYAQVYGTQPNAAQLASLQGQIDYFTKLYAANNVPNGAIAAKGAVLGQIVGYAFTSSASANAILDNQVQSMLTSAAKGDTSVYAKALPTVTDPGTLGVTINLTNSDDNVGLNSADPALRSTNNNDTIISSATANFVTTDVIDAGLGADKMFLKELGAVGEVKISNLEQIYASLNGGAGTIDLKSTTGLDQFWVTKVAAATDKVAISNASGSTVFGFGLTSVNAADKGTGGTLATTTASTIDYKAGVTAANIALGETDATGVRVKTTVAGTANTIDTLNVSLVDDAGTTTSSSANVNKLTFDDTGLKTVVVTGAGGLEFVSDSTGITSIDAAAITGGLTFAASAATATIKGGAGADNITGVAKNGAVVTLGAGNDKVTFALAAATDTATVTGGAGADTYTLGATGKVTMVFNSASESLGTNPDSIASGFDSGSDKFDFRGFSASLTKDKGGINAFNPVTAVTEGTDIFAGKAFAYGNLTAVGGDKYLVVDANNDGVYNAGADLVIKVVGGSTIVIGDILV